MNINAFWKKKSIGNYALFPFSLLYACVIACRLFFYRIGIFSSRVSHIPVVVVGNISVGGAGKTPLVIALGHLLAKHNITYAVVSKGYGGTYESARVVSEHDSPNVVGDEPLLIKIKCHCPVVVAKSRIEACEIVLKDYPDTQIILSDDGLQHYQLKSDVEVCVINSRIGLGNNLLLPAGPLREPKSRLKSIDFVVMNGGQQAKYNYVLAERGWRNTHDISKIRYPDEFSMERDDNIALSGIAHPQLFFERIDNMGISCNLKPLSDHYTFTQSDLPEDKTLLMTEKDWVKVKSLRHKDAWFLKTEAVLSESLEVDFMETINKLLP